jgi:hypothetical protein
MEAMIRVDVKVVRWHGVWWWKAKCCLGGQQKRLMGTSSGGEYKGVGGQATRKGQRHKLEDLRSPVALFFTTITALLDNNKLRINTNLNLNSNCYRNNSNHSSRSIS